MSEVWKIGVIGGVASGKSAAAQLLADWGAWRIDADRVAHEVLDEPGVRRRLVEHFGPEILGPDGRIDRHQLGGRVFGEEPTVVANRRLVESIVHPRVKERIVRELEQAAASGAQTVVLDVPLLLEVGWRDLVDDVLFVDASNDVRRERARARGWTEEQWRQREAAQWPAERKRQQADAIIDNSGTRDDLRRELLRWWTEKTGKTSSRSGSNRS